MIGADDLRALLANEAAMKDLFATKFWKQSKFLNTSEQCDEAAALVADLLRYMVENDDYVESLLRHFSPETLP